MLINNIDISEYHAVLLDRSISINKVNTYEDWNDGAISSIFIRQQNSFRKIKLTFLIKGDSEEDAFINISKLTQNIKKSNLIFDDASDLVFPVTLNKRTEPERLINGVFKIVYELDNSYATGETQTFELQDISKKYTLKVIYCQDNEFNQISKISKVISPEMFFNITTISDLIDINQFKPVFYKDGTVLNILPDPLTYEALVDIDTIIIVYTEEEYNISFNYYSVTDTSFSNPVFLGNEILAVKNSDFKKYSRYSDIININKYKPENNIAIFNDNDNFNLSYAIINSPFKIYYVPREGEQEKSVTVKYFNENTLLAEEENILHEFDFYPTNNIKNVININKYLDPSSYDKGVVQEEKYQNQISFSQINEGDIITIIYSEKTLSISFSYYKNNQYITTTFINVKASDFTDETTLYTLGFDPNRYLPAYYENRQDFSSIVTYEQLAQNPYIRVDYSLKTFNIPIVYYKDLDNPTVVGTENLSITIEDFESVPNYYNLIQLGKYIPDDYKFNSINPQSVNSFYDLINKSEIQIYYVKASTPSGGGGEGESTGPARKGYWIYFFKDIYSPYVGNHTDTEHYLGKQKYYVTDANFNINTTYKDLFYSEIQKRCPNNYNPGNVELYHRVPANNDYKFSINQKIAYKDFVYYDEDKWMENKGEGEYYVIYKDTPSALVVNYYVDSAINSNLINSDIIYFTKDSASRATSLTDLGLQINKFQPSYCKEGIVSYTGEITFNNLLNLSSIDIVYPHNKITDLPDETTVVYPNRILYVLGDNTTDFDLGVGKGYRPSDITIQVVGRYSKISTNSKGNGCMFYAHPLENGFRLSGEYLYVGGGYAETAYKVYKSTPVGTSGVKYEDISKNPLSSHALTGVQGGNYLDVKFDGATIARRNVNDDYELEENIHIFNDAKQMYPGNYIEIASVKVYIQNNLVRDLIAVAEDDIIGRLPAPSNCFFDKITRTFFESKNVTNVYAKDNLNAPIVSIEPFITVAYYTSEDGLIGNKQVLINESMFINDPALTDIIDIDAYKPIGYSSGVADYTGPISFNDLKYKTIKILYSKETRTLQVMYYNQTKKDDAASLQYIGQASLEYTDNIDKVNNVTLNDLNYNRDLYREEGYEIGVSNLDNQYITSQILASTSFVSVVYRPTEYTVRVSYFMKAYDNYVNIGSSFFSFIKNDLTSAQSLADLGLNLNLYLPEGFQIEKTSFVDADYSSSAFPNQKYGIDKMKNLKEISVYYEPIPSEPPEEEEEKTFTVKYQYIDYIQRYLDDTNELFEKNIMAEATVSYTYTAATFPTEGSYVKDLISEDIINRQPNFYDEGILDVNDYLTFDTLEDGTEYLVFYGPKTFSKNVQYYIDDFDSENYLGASTIYYTPLSWIHKENNIHSVNLFGDLLLKPNLFRLDNYSVPHVYINDVEITEEQEEYESFLDLHYNINNIKVLYYTQEAPIVDYNEKLPNNLILEWTNPTEKGSWMNQISFHIFNIEDLFNITENPIANKLKYEVKFQAIAKNINKTHPTGQPRDERGFAPLMTSPIGAAYWYVENDTSHPWHDDPNNSFGLLGTFTNRGRNFTSFWYDSDYLKQAFPITFIDSCIESVPYNKYYHSYHNCVLISKETDYMTSSVMQRYVGQTGNGGSTPVTIENFAIDFEYDEDNPIVYYPASIREEVMRRWIELEAPYDKPFTLTVDYTKGIINKIASSVIQEHMNELPPYELYLGAATDYRSRKSFGWGYYPDSGFIEDANRGPSTPQSTTGGSGWGRSEWVHVVGRYSEYVDPLRPNLNPRFRTDDIVGIYYMRVWNAKFWYDDELIHDFIPMAKGTTYWGVTAEENCLFDKITKTCYYGWLGNQYKNSRLSDLTNVYADPNIEEVFEPDVEDPESDDTKFLVWENDSENDKIGYIQITENNELSLGAMNISGTVRYKGEGLIFGFQNENDKGYMSEELYSTIVSGNDAFIFGITDIYKDEFVTYNKQNIKKNGFNQNITNTLAKNLYLSYRVTNSKGKASNFIDYGEFNTPATFIDKTDTSAILSLYNSNFYKNYQNEYNLVKIGKNIDNLTRDERYDFVRSIGDIDYQTANQAGTPENTTKSWRITGYGAKYVEANKNYSNQVPYSYLSSYPKAPLYFGVGTMFSKANNSSEPYTNDSNGITKFAIKDLIVSSYNKEIHNFQVIDTGETIGSLIADAPGLYDKITNKIYYVQNAKRVYVTTAGELKREIGD